MASLLDKLKIKNLVEEGVFSTTYYEGAIFAGYTNLGTFTLTSDGQLGYSIGSEHLTELSDELSSRPATVDGFTIKEHIKGLVEEAIKDKKTYELLEVPRDYLRDYVLENPDNKYFSFVILYIKENGQGSMSVYQTEQSTQTDSIETVIKNTGSANKESKQAVKILGFHYVSLRKIVTTEVL